MLNFDVCQCHKFNFCDVLAHCSDVLIYKNDFDFKLPQ
jgi:hypothetical protein